MTEQRFYQIKRCEDGNVRLSCTNVRLYGYFDTIDEALNSFVGECDEQRSNALLLASRRDKDIAKAKDLVNAHKDVEAKANQLPEVVYSISSWGLKKDTVKRINEFDIKIGYFVMDFPDRINTSDDKAVADYLAIVGYYPTPEQAVETFKALVTENMAKLDAQLANS